MGVQVPSLALLNGLGIWLAMSCDVGRRPGSDLALPWLWHRPAADSSDSTPSLGTSICRGWGPKKTNNNNKKIQLQPAEVRV